MRVPAPFPPLNDLRRGVVLQSGLRTAFPPHVALHEEQFFLLRQVKGADIVRRPSRGHGGQQGADGPVLVVHRPSPPAPAGGSASGAVAGASGYGGLSGPAGAAAHILSL